MDPAREQIAVEGASVAAALEESFQDLYDDAPCGYLSTLADGTIVKVNQTFLRWTGFAREDLVGRRRFQDLLTAGGRIYHETHYAPLLRMQGSVREIAVEIVRADGVRLPALVNSVLKTDADGRPVVVRTTVFDATERRRYEEQLLRERERARTSEMRARDLADTLQASLIPPEPSQIPGLEVAAAYRPAGLGDTVGGDFYDVFETNRGDWVIVMGDVSGKGVEAARVTAAARYTLRATATRSTRPRVLLSSLNEVLIAHGFDRYCTVVYARITKMTDGAFRMTVSSAGHPLPIMVTSSGDPTNIGTAGTLLGAFAEPQLSDVSVEIPPGASVVFYTDGVTEARGAAGFFGEEALCAIVRSHRSSSASDLTSAILDEVVAFQEGTTRDDIAVLVVRRPED